MEGPKRALWSKREKISGAEALDSLSTSPPPLGVYSAVSPMWGPRGNGFDLLHPDPVSFGVKQNIGQWGRMFLDNLSCERGGGGSSPRLRLPSAGLVLEMWEVCLAEPAAGFLKNAPRLAKRPAFLWNVRIIGTRWAAVGVPVVTAGLRGTRHHGNATTSQEATVLFVWRSDCGLLGFRGLWSDPVVSQDTVTQKSHTGINMVHVIFIYIKCDCISSVQNRMYKLHSNFETCILNTLVYWA